MEINSALLAEYAPLVIIIVAFLLREKIFVTPVQLAETKEEILAQVKLEFSTKEAVNEIKDDIKRIEDKIDNLIEILLKK